MRVGIENMFVSFAEKTNRIENTLRKEISEKEEIINHLFAQVEKERKIKSKLIAKIKEKNLLHRAAASDIQKVELEKIIITSLPPSEGKVLAIDNQEDVVVVSLGSVNNVKIGDRFSVYRGTDFIGDVELLKVQKQLSAGTILSEAREVKIAVNDSIRRF